MDARFDSDLIAAIRARARTLEQTLDLTSLIDRIKDSRIVMLGEATHGTHEFYELRRLISEWLVTKHGFRFIAVEGDWPPCQAVQHYIHAGEGKDARSVLGRFNRWPTWMWANTEILRLAEWMRSHNTRHPEERKAGFHGLDVYSLFESIEAVLELLDSINPFLARRVRARYGCFDPYREDEMRYARSLIDFPEGCENEVVENLREILRLRLDGFHDREDMLFDAQQNARIIAQAENFYRAMVHGNEDSWNVRDRHMMDTLEHLLAKYGPEAKGIVWAHNTHIGDYRATDMAQQGQINLGGLARERHGEQAVSLVGFGTYQGTVIASHAWDGPIEKLDVPPGRSGSYEDAFHRALAPRGLKRAMLIFDEADRTGALAEVHGHRAIGVVYQPGRERWGCYVPTSLARRYDAFVFVDETRALDPLIQNFDQSEIPETYPVGQ